MITKAIIERVEEDGYSFKVRIPIYHKIKDVPGSTPFEELPIAPCCVPPGVTPNLSVGDIVWVAFADNQKSEPVILGVLYSEKNMGITSTINAETITADSSVQFTDFDNVFFGNQTLHNLLDTATSNIPMEN